MTDLLTRPVLLIEDDPDIVKLIRLHIAELGVTLDSAADGLEGLEMALSRTYRLVILDLGLPGIGGIELCKRLRAQKPLLPIMILTSRADEIDKVVGFEVGADDYVVKPFSTRELMARIGAILRRSEAIEAGSAAAPAPGSAAAPASDSIRFGDIEIRVARRQVLLGGAPQDLTPTEFELLLFLAQHPNRAFTREQLVETVLGYHGSGYEKTINSHISRLRGKLERDPENPEYITTVWGIGYCFVLPE